MGARQSKRSVDIAGATKKGELDNGTVEEGARLERLEEGDLVKTTQNGTAPHTATTPATEVRIAVKQLLIHYEAAPTLPLASRCSTYATSLTGRRLTHRACLLLEFT